MSLHSKTSLHKKLQNPKFREAFVSSRIAQTISAQVKVMRQKREMSQKDLARELGTSQNAIYRLENPKYGRPSISTLRKVASFFDVGLIVRFASYGEIVDWTLRMSPRSIDVPRFDEENFGEIRHPARKAMKEAKDFTLPYQPHRKHTTPQTQARESSTLHGK